VQRDIVEPLALAAFACDGLAVEPFVPPDFLAALLLVEPEIRTPVP
jgi:hypothetical protein